MKKLIGASCFLMLSAMVHAQDPNYPAINGANSYHMHDNAFYDANKEWCYIPKHTTVIGMPFSPAPVQVTFDGSIFTNDAEMFFYYGKDMQPLLATQKTFKNGWIPVVEYSWQKDGISYEISMFGWAAAEEFNSNSIQHIQVKMKNTSDKAQEAVFGTGIRATGVDSRYRGVNFKDDFQYAFEGNEFKRNGKIVYSFSGKPTLYAVKGTRYENAFSGKDFKIEKETAVGLASYNQKLQPGETYEVTLKFPRIAIDNSESQLQALYRKSTFAGELAKCEAYWKKQIEGNGHFAIPEKRVNDSYKAALVHLMLATRTSKDGVKRQGSGLPYDGLFFIDFIDMRLAYDVAGLADFVEVNFDWLRNSINEEGLFVDNSVSHNREIMTSHGQALYSICNHFRYVDDKKLAQSMLKTVKRAVALIEKDHRTQPNGLVRPSLPFDAEMIQGHYTGQNLFCLLGLRSAISYAEYLGLKKEAADWRKLEASYRNSIALALEQSARPDGYIPPGLFEYKWGKDCGWADYRTNQDWENPLLVYPSEILAPSDPKVIGTLKHIRKNKFREGIMTYRNGMHLHQYVTTNLTNQHIAINDPHTALLDLYHILLHNGSTHEGFENLINPWGDRYPQGCPPPHAWAAAKTAMLIRNCLVREYGGEAGMNIQDRSLYLYSVLSPAWVKAGESVKIIDALTEFGKINSTLTFTENGAVVTVQPTYKHQPQSIRIAIPYFKALASVKVDHNKSYRIENGYIVCPADAKKIELTWKDKEMPNEYQQALINYRKEPGYYWKVKNDSLYTLEPTAIMDKGGQLVVIPGQEEGFLTEEEKKAPKEALSFDVIKKAYITEYDRRKAQYIKAGKALTTVKVPAIK